jgi:hypothetical protein
MALGNTYNNNSKKDYQPMVYSAYKMNNAESTVDQTSVSFTFWNGMLKISIAPRKPGNEISFDFDNAAVIYLNHTKARILENEILSFMADPIGHNNAGVPSGTGLITISNGQDYGVECPCLVIRKINQENGNVESSYAYQIKQSYYYGINNYSEKDGSFNKDMESYNLIELQQLLCLLHEYYTAMTNAVAYTVIDQNKYDVSRVNTKLELIGEKLGVTFSGGRKGSGSGSSASYFNNKSGNSGQTASPSYSQASIEDIESQFGDE